MDCIRWPVCGRCRTSTTATATKAVAQGNVAVEPRQDTTERGDLRNLAIVAHVGEWPRLRSWPTFCFKCVFVATYVAVVHTTVISMSSADSGVDMPFITWIFPARLRGRSFGVTH